MKNKSADMWAGLPSGATVMVDTAPFIYVLEENEQFAEQFVGLFEAAAQGKLTIALSSISLAEILSGPCSAGKTALAKRYEKALSEYKVIPVSVSIAALAAQLRTQHHLNLPDAIQLATAIDIGATAFVTHDRDLSQVSAMVK